MRDKRVLVTGGSGFLGSAVAAALGVDNDVTVAHHSSAPPRDASVASLALDITDIAEVRAALFDLRPEVIVHAAAMKSVGECERKPLECSDINVVGSQNIGRVAMQVGTETVVGISSTRATPPTGDTYGLTKAILERMFCSLNGKTTTKFTSVRLGNVVWSPGSVLAEWKRMLDESGTVGTTGHDMRRFFLSRDDAVAATLTALDHIDDIQGKTIAPQMGQALIADVLDRFVAHHGGSWERLEAREGDQPEERLVGDLELRYCQPAEFDGRAFYVFAFNDPEGDPMPAEVTTANAPALSTDEIDRLIAAGPDSTEERS